MASCWIDARGEMVPNDEPPTDPRGVVKKEVEFAVSSSLSENRLKIKTNKQKPLNMHTQKMANEIDFIHHNVYTVICDMCICVSFPQNSLNNH